MRRIWLAAVGLVLFALSQLATGQIGYLWSFDERTAKADLVVIAARVVTRDTGKKTTIRELSPPFPVIEVQTEFKIVVVLKGTHGSDRVVLRHYRWDQDRLGPGGVVNGPHPLNFAIAAEPRTELLLFLRRDVDGVFVPVTGQVFPADSVFVLRRAG